MKRLLCAAVLLVTGCQSSPTRLSEDQAELVIVFAKRAATVSGLLTMSEASHIDSTKPSMSYYFIAGSFADYSIRWTLPEGEEVVVSGRGDIYRLENAKVTKKKPNQTPEPTPTAVTPRADARVAPSAVVAHL